MMHLINKFEHLKIQLEAIKLATDNFADENCIGRGGFGKVYKGKLVHSNGQTVVALKRLDPKFGQGNPEFWKEIIMLSLYKHTNIVSLLGFCDENNEKILVYEYASRSSLDSYLNKDDLTWIRRLNICIGVARGLAYLHYPGGTQQRVLHRDIKSSNILLDENWNAKISDLGLSKFGPANQQYTFLVSNVVGTIGYCDPLYIETGLLTKESDVYSFGVVLFEVLCGRLCIINKKGIGIHQSLTSLVRQYYPQNKIGDLIYDNIKDEMNPKSLDTFVTIAYQCLKRDLEDRPLMADVVSILQSALAYQNGDSVGGSETRQSNINTCQTEKIGFGLVGSGKRTAVPSLLHEEEDEDAQKDKKMRPLVPIDYTQELQAVRDTTPLAPSALLATATEFAKRIGNGNSKDEKPDSEREQSRRSYHRDRNYEKEREKDKTPDNKKLLDAKQLIDTIPKTKDELFSYPINWGTYDKNGLHERMRPWISMKIKVFLGDEEPTLVDYIVSSTQEHVTADEMVDRLQLILDFEAEIFVMKMWRMLIFEIKKLDTGLSLSLVGRSKASY